MNSLDEILAEFEDWRACETFPEFRRLILALRECREQRNNWAYSEPTRSKVIYVLADQEQELAKILTGTEEDFENSHSTTAGGGE